MHDVLQRSDLAVELHCVSREGFKQELPCSMPAKEQWPYTILLLQGLHVDHAWVQSAYVTALKVTVLACSFAWCQGIVLEPVDTHKQTLYLGKHSLPV